MGNQPAKLALTTEAKARSLRKKLLPYSEAVRPSRQAQAMSDPTRLILMRLLRDAERLCVTDLCLISGVEQGSTSRHLRVLWDAGLVSRERYYRAVIYRLTAAGERLLTALFD